MLQLVAQRRVKHVTADEGLTCFTFQAEAWHQVKPIKRYDYSRNAIAIGSHPTGADVERGFVLFKVARMNVAHPTHAMRGLEHIA